jgi:hypothetical protein
MNETVTTTRSDSPAAEDDDSRTLMAGIIGDFQTLMVQQFRLTRQEITDNLRLRKAAGIYVALATGVGMLAALAWTMASVHLLHWSLSPSGTDPAWLPLGACYAVVGLVLIALSSGLCLLGRAKFDAIPPWQNLADEFFEEPQSWTKIPK